MSLRLPRRKQPLERFSPAADQAPLFRLRSFFTYTPFLYDWLLHPVYWIRRIIVSGCFLYFLQTGAFMASTIYHLNLGIFGITASQGKGMGVGLFFGGQHLNDLLRISLCTGGRIRQEK